MEVHTGSVERDNMVALSQSGKTQWPPFDVQGEATYHFDAGNTLANRLDLFAW